METIGSLTCVQGVGFPRSREILDNILADCTEEEKAKISGGNAARIYNLN